MYIHTDEDTGIIHISPTYGVATLCGLPHGYTEPDAQPVVKKFKTTCEGCQEAIKEIKSLRVDNK